MPPWVWILIAIVVVTVLNIIGIVSVARANFLLLALQTIFIVVLVVMAFVTIAGYGSVNLVAPFTGDGTVGGVDADLRGRGHSLPVLPRVRRGVDPVGGGEGSRPAPCRRPS